MIIDTGNNKIRKYNSSAVKILSLFGSGNAVTINEIVYSLAGDWPQSDFPKEFVEEFVASLKTSAVVEELSPSRSSIDD